MILPWHHLVRRGQILLVFPGQLSSELEQSCHLGVKASLRITPNYIRKCHDVYKYVNKHLTYIHTYMSVG